MKKLLFIPLMILFFCSLHAQQIAFPGAEGHGRYTAGGRGGKVYYVTTLEDNGSTSLVGSLRWALNQSSPKTILFKVSGTIYLAAALKISKSNVTIAGQSAPGSGICIAGYPVTITASDVIIRFLRFRMGDNLDANADGADALGARQIKNIIIDHCSMSWSTDECVSLYENENTTLQWCIIAESLRLSGHSKGPHGYGGIWGGVNASFHHNLMAHHDSRMPRFGPGVSTQGREIVDMRNNVIYNWSGNGCYGAEAMNINVVNNFYRPGPATPSNTSKRGRIVTIDKKTGLSSSDGFYSINDVWGKFYIDGNVVDASSSTLAKDVTSCNNATNDNWTYGVLNQISSTYAITTAEKDALKVDAPFSSDVVTTHKASDAYEKVLVYAGASLVRDSHDARVVEETRTGTAAFKGLSPYNGLGEVTYPAGTVIGSTTLTVQTTIDWKSASGYPKYGVVDSQDDIKPADATSEWTAWPALSGVFSIVDADNDGMPDDWESTNGVTNASGYDLDANYTNLEVYLNGLVRNVVDNQNKDAISNDINHDLGSTSINVYPNPVNDVLNVVGLSDVTSVKIYNIGGILLHQQTVGDSEALLDFSSYARGVYLVSVEKAIGFVDVVKVIKN